MEILPFFEFMVEKGASDIFFSTGARANIKVEGRTIPLDHEPLDAETLKGLAYSLMSEAQIVEFERDLELNMAVAREGVGRFRVNVFRQRGDVGMVIRYINDRIPSIESLGLPELLTDLVLEKRGQILVVGATGSGKSTTLAAMINHRNERMTGHILCIEDPIEFTHDHKRSVVDQREVGFDTVSYSHALENALRQAPEVIVIGEIRDRETMEHALRFSETGHLCISTLHANSANQALGRIVHFFPRHEQDALLHDLALNLRAVISQRLVPGAKGRSVVAVEVMLNTPRIADLIATGRSGEIKELMETGSARGMMTFDQSLYRLYRKGMITGEAALANADSSNDLRLRIHMENTRKATAVP